MKKLFIVVLLIVGLLVPAVSAEILYDENFNEYEFTGGRTVWNVAKGSSGTTLNRFIVDDIAKLQDLQYIGLEFDRGFGIMNLVEGTNEITYTTSYDSTPKQAIVEKTYYRNLLGDVIHSKYIFYFPDWDIGDATGSAQIYIPSTTTSYGSIISKEGDSPVSLNVNVHNGKTIITVASGKTFKNHLLVSDNKLMNNLNVKLTRIIDGKPSASNLTVFNGSEIIYNDYSSRDVDEDFLLDRTSLITLANGEKIYEYPIGDTVTPDDSNVNIYVRNSQTGALLADAHIDISANVNGEFHEVINQTLPSGIYTGNLYPTGDSFPNPDFYRLITTAEGYISVVPQIDFEVDGVTTINVYMDPIAGGPLDENNTFIDFYVRDLSANPISGATVNFGGYTMITNSAGYTVLEVAKNATYSWTVSKSGYGSLTGNAVIGADPRHTINTVLAPAVTPTTQTPIPPSTSISPTPTMTAPTGEPVSNWLEWFAAHFGMILGGGVEIGKIFMWLCFTVPAGVYVGKEAKAGAAGFMAGAGIVTLFFVLIGWVPIWLVVLLALIIGLLYAKVYSNSDNGGGR